MKNIILSLALTLALMLSFAGCGNNKSNSSMADNGNNSTVSSKASDKDESIMNDSKDDTELKDGSYTAESDKKDDDGYKEYVTVTVENGKISKINCDAKNDKGELKKDDKSMSAWVDKMAIFENEVVNKGIENISLDASGKVTDLEGMDLNVSGYSELIKEALDKAKK